MPSTTELIAGFTAGCCTTICCQPIDRIKVRRQVEIGKLSKYGQSLKIACDIWSYEGGLRAFYRGFTPNLAGNASCWAFYFMWYDRTKSYISSLKGEKPLTSTDYLLASASSSVFTSICTNPIWVIKTRMFATSQNSQGAYSSMSSGMKHLVAKEGLRGLFRGLTPSLLGVPQYAIQFSIYENLKIWRSRKRENLNNIDFGVLSACAKLVAGTLTYPHQVLRSRMQNSPIEGRLSMWILAKDIWRLQDLRGYYKGIGPNFLRIIPSTCITFVVYENVRFYLQSLLSTPFIQVVPTYDA